MTEALQSPLASDVAASKEASPDFCAKPKRPMAPLWHHETIAPRAPKKNKQIIVDKKKTRKANLSFEGALIASGPGEHAENIGNAYSFAHAK